MAKPKNVAGKPHRGPKAEILQLNVNWEDAVKHAFGRGKPIGSGDTPKDKKVKKKARRRA